MIGKRKQFLNKFKDTPYSLLKTDSEKNDYARQLMEAIEKTLSGKHTSLFGRITGYSPFSNLDEFLRIINTEGHLKSNGAFNTELITRIIAVTGYDLGTLAKMQDQYIKINDSSNNKALKDTLDFFKTIQIHLLSNSANEIQKNEQPSLSQEEQLKTLKEALTDSDNQFWVVLPDVSKPQNCETIKKLRENNDFCNTLQKCYTALKICIESAIKNNSFQINQKEMQKPNSLIRSMARVIAGNGIPDLKKLEQGTKLNTDDFADAMKAEWMKVDGAKKFLVKSSQENQPNNFDFNNNDKTLIDTPKSSPNLSPNGKTRL